jgi:hypothetical protein
MAARRKASASAKATAPTSQGLRLVDVPQGHWARLFDGTEVRVAATIGDVMLVRRSDDAPRTGPTPMPGDTQVRSTRAADLAPVDRTAVADPLAGTAREPDLLRREDA